MTPPTVSIVLPVHNAANSLDAAIDSIVVQTHVRWELLVILNACTDKSHSVATAWCDRDPRIKVLDEPRIGIAHALNTGLVHATAPLIARMDADDIAHPDRLRQQVAYMGSYPGIGVLGTRTRFVSSLAQSAGMRAFVDWQNAILSPHDHFVKRFVDAPLAHPTVMFRRELVDRAGGYDTGPLPEDHELWLRWMDAGVQFAKLPEELLTWHDHAGRLSRSHPNYSTDAFQRLRGKWLARWLNRELKGRPLIIAGTSGLCRERARALAEQGLAIHAFTDVSGRAVPGSTFIPHDRLPPAGAAFIVSFISQRGTGDRIAAYLCGRGLVEGTDFLLAA